MRWLPPAAAQQHQLWCTATDKPCLCKTSHADLSLESQPHVLKGSAALRKPELRRLCELGPTALLPAQKLSSEEGQFCPKYWVVPLNTDLSIQCARDWRMLLYLVFPVSFKTATFNHSRRKGIPQAKMSDGYWTTEQSNNMWTWLKLARKLKLVGN